MIDYDKPDDDPIVAEVRRVRLERFMFDRLQHIERVGRPEVGQELAGHRSISSVPLREPLVPAAPSASELPNVSGS